MQSTALIRKSKTRTAHKRDSLVGKTCRSGEEGISAALLSIASRDDLENAVEHANELSTRLGARDAVRGARVTNDARHSIQIVESVARTLRELQAVRDGKIEPTYDTAGRMLALRQRWSRLLPNAPMTSRTNRWIETLLQEAVAAALKSNATDGVKSQHTRALQQWLPTPTPPGSLSSTQSDYSHSPGTKVEWDSDDDL
eukprot:2397279-Prymnesium_polylepis.1